MAGQTLTTASLLQCPHGGKVQIISSHNTTGYAESAAVATASDTYVIAGCPFMMTVPIPSPCVTVRWMTPDSVLRIKDSPSLSESSVGLCLSAAGLPQGAVLILETQPILGSR